jgi:hypothetical protein
MKKNIYETIGELFCDPGGGALGSSMRSYRFGNAILCLNVCTQENLIRRFI